MPNQLLLSSNKPIGDLPAVVVKKEPTPDPKFHQSHLETDDDESETEEVHKPAEKNKSKRGRHLNSRRPTTDAKTKEIQNEHEGKAKKLNKSVAQQAPLTKVVANSKPAVVEVISRAKSPEITDRPAERKTYSSLKRKKPSIGPLKTKVSKKSASRETEEVAVTTASVTKIVENAPQEPPVIEQTDTDDDLKVNELKNLLQNITKGDAKDPKLLDSFQNILGKDGFAKLKSLFVEDLGSAECKPEEKPKEEQPLPVELEIQAPQKVDTKPRRSDSPLRMPPVSNHHPRGRKKTEVDRLNQDIMSCFIRDGILNAHGLRNVNKVKYEEVVAMEDYELDAGSCSDTDVDEPLVKPRKGRVPVISRTPSTSHESTPEPPPATKSLFIFDQKVELCADTMEYRLLSGITGKFEVCDELKEAFLGFCKQLQASTSVGNVDSDEREQKPMIYPKNDVIFDPMEIITIEDDDVADPPAEQTESTSQANFELITIDDDSNDSNATIECPILESVMNSQNGGTYAQPEQDMIYNQVKEFAPHIVNDTPSRIVYYPENRVCNLTFFENNLGLILRCHAEKCPLIERNKEMFKYHVQTRHCLFKWDGSCELCKGSVYGYGTLLDEYNHMERYHMSKLKPSAPENVDSRKITLIPETYHEQPASTASSPKAAAIPPEPTPKQQPTLQLNNRPFNYKIITPSKLRQVLVQPPTNPTVPPVNLTLRLRNMPGDKLSGGSQSTVRRSDSSTESPVKNTVQLAGTYRPIAPAPAASSLSTISTPSVSSAPQNTMTVNQLPQNTMTVSQLPQNMMTVSQPPSNATISVLQPAPGIFNGTTIIRNRQVVMPSSLVTQAPNQPYSTPMIVSVMSVPQTPPRLIHASVASAPAVQRSRLLRPWLDDDDMKSLSTIQKMTQVDCLRNLFKCMAAACFFNTNSSVSFAEHLAVHSKLNAPCQLREYARCAYCLFKASTITDLVSHIHIEHKFDVYGCTQCFYRAISPDTVRDHEKMFHKYTGIQIKCNYATDTLIPYKDAVLAAKEGRRAFVPMISCAGEFYGVLSNTRRKCRKFSYF